MAVFFAEMITEIKYLADEFLSESTELLRLPTAASTTAGSTEQINLIAAVGKAAFVYNFYLVVGCLAFMINLFIFVILLIERSRNTNITELLMINQVSAF